MSLLCRLLMSLRMAPPPPLVFLLMVVGASGAEWSVKYKQQEICALNGSTVFMNGTFTYPERLTVTETFWAVDPVPKVEPTDLIKVPDFSGRVEYFTAEQKHFSLKLSNVMKEDEHKYLLRIKTNEESQKYLGRPGVKLSVTELQVESPGEVTKGETADLMCKTTCSLTDPTFIWYKNGRPLTTKTLKNNQLHLQTVSSEDAGRYSCAVRGSEHLPSTAQTLRVRYPPKSVSVYVSPSGEIVEGSSVNLTCSSDANPPVQNYTWFKEGGSSPVGSGHTYSITSISADHTGLYYCEALNAVGAQNGSVRISVQTQSRSAVWIAAVGFLLLLLLMVLICIYRMKKRNTRADHDGPTQDDVLYANATPSRPVETAVHVAFGAPDDDVQYATVKHSRSRPVETAVHVASGAPDDDVQYATVKHCRSRLVETAQL
ncbi:Fc receptor-like protein 2 isoform X2 [Salminus brasiliensis]|uniref:Fc receptor-like protein 2 isoform X2 n=1 Tax=Salminus brasiliensis TaxID=930266 RepID=UPI003B82EB0E